MALDVTKPAAGSPVVKADIRANLAALRDAIDRMGADGEGGPSGATRLNELRAKIDGVTTDVTSAEGRVTALEAGLSAWPPAVADSPSDVSGIASLTPVKLTAGGRLRHREQTTANDSDWIGPPLAVDETLDATFELAAGDNIDLYFYRITGGAKDLLGSTEDRTATPKSVAVRLKPGEVYARGAFTGAGLDREYRTELRTTRPAPEKPTVTAPALSVVRNATTAIDLLAGAVDPLGLELSLKPLPATTAAGGALALRPDGRTVDYTPPTGFAGPDSFAYEVVNAAGLATAATARLTVTAVVAGAAPADARYKPSLPPTGEPWPFPESPMWVAPNAPVRPGNATVNPGGNLQAAVNALRPGQTLKIGSGTWADVGRITVGCKGTAAEPIVIEAARGWEPRFVGRSRWMLSGAEHVYLRGLDFDGIRYWDNDDQGYTVTVRNGSRHCVVEDCLIRNTTVGSGAYFHHMMGAHNTASYIWFKRNCFVNIAGLYVLGTKPEHQNTRHIYFDDTWFYNCRGNNSNAVNIQIGTNQRENLGKVQSYCMARRSVCVLCPQLEEVSSKVSKVFIDGHVSFDHKNGRAWESVSLRGGFDCVLSNGYYRDADIAINVTDTRHKIYNNVVVDGRRRSGIRGAVGSWTTVHGASPQAALYSTNANLNNSWYHTNECEFYNNTIVIRTPEINSSAGVINFIYFQDYKFAGGGHNNRSDEDKRGEPWQPNQNKWHGNLFWYGPGAPNPQGNAWQGAAIGAFSDGSYRHNHWAYLNGNVSPFPPGPGHQGGNPDFEWIDTPVRGPGNNPFTDVVTRTMTVPYPKATSPCVAKVPAADVPGVARGFDGRPRPSGNRTMGAVEPR